MDLISFSIAKTGQRGGGMVWSTIRVDRASGHIPSRVFHQVLYRFISCLHCHHLIFTSSLPFMSAFSSRVFQQVLYRFMSAFSSRVFQQDHYSLTSALPLCFPSNPLQFAIICFSAGPSPFHVLCLRSPLFTKAFSVFRQIHNRSVLPRHRLFLLAGPLSVHVC